MVRKIFHVDASELEIAFKYQFVSIDYQYNENCTRACCRESRDTGFKEIFKSSIKLKEN